MYHTTERLILREFVAENWPAVLTYHADPRSLRFYEQDSCTPEEAQATAAPSDPPIIRTSITANDASCSRCLGYTQINHVQYGKRPWVI